ncbi:uncharacterized protein C3orf20-like [Gadus chalcogrammus]|uniref:uncharacterized protein C3orf20-like n=1 Tax=Gadus chalcogrammus TaxID=1042646 RepID=UPI0024C4B30A|nr:uncharacterized protein C3orf20-like [Gadus chalcogrammus]
MSSLGARREFKTGPLYFFDQNKDHTVNGESNVCDRIPDQKVVDPLGAYKDAAPELLGELESLLSRYQWSEEGCIPRGVVNILNCSSQDLTAVVLESGKSPFQGAHCAKHTLNLKSHIPVADRNTPKELIVESVRKLKKKKSSPKLPFERKVKPRPDLPTRAFSPDAHKDRANASSSISFSMSSKICKDQGWIVEAARLCYEEPQRSAVWQWVLQRLQSAQIPIELQATRDRERGLDKPPVVRHYGAVRSHYRNKRAVVDEQRPFVLVHGMPQIPQVHREDPSERKLHYGTPDGSSVVYYPSGGVAVCQTGSGLPCGGFYTNVFSDRPSPAVIASMTAFGRGAATHAVSGVVSAVWDRAGGKLCGPDGTVTKEWSWLRGSGSKERVLIQVSDSISVKLLNGTSGLLRFKCQGETIQLPLSALSSMPPPTDTVYVEPNQRLMTRKEPMLPKRRVPGHSAESRLLPVQTASADRSRRRRRFSGNRKVAGDAVPLSKAPETPACSPGVALRLPTAPAVLVCPRVFTGSQMGLRCPDIERLPGAPRRARRPAVAAPHSLNPLGWEDPRPGPPPTADPPRHLSAAGGFPLRASTGDDWARSILTPRRAVKEESRVTQVGALRVHSNIRLE